jgi:DNA polymerase III delta prime subunit
MSSEFLFVEKYRPKTIEDCILPQSVKDRFRGFLDQGELPNLLLSGPPGTGKTTIALATIETLGHDYLFINGSEDSGIDVLRDRIRRFASTVSLSGGRKYVIIDEADYLNPSSTQPAFRGFIEEFSKNCGFIFTCNFPDKLLEALRSRFTQIDFRIDADSKPALAANFHKRVISILENEGIEYDKKVIAQMIMDSFPDFRKVLNTIQGHSTSGRIDAGALSGTGADFDTLVKTLKDKDFKNMRKWVGTNSDLNTTAFFRNLYDNMYDFIKKEHIPQVVIILAEYQYKSAFVADQEINMCACLTEIMAGGLCN